MRETRRCVLVTGAGGALGKAVLRELERSQWRVRALWLRSAGEPPRDFAGVSWVSGDVCLPETLAHALDGCDAVLHMAGIIMSRDPSAFFRVNAEGTAHLARAAEIAGVSRWVQVSSISVEYARRTDYARSKHAGELAVQQSRLSWSIARPTLVVGRGGGAEYQLFARLCSLPVVFLPRGGQARKRPVHVSDLARGLVQLLNAGRNTEGKIYALAGAETLTLAQMLYAMRMEKEASGRERFFSVRALPEWPVRRIARMADRLSWGGFSWEQVLEGLLQDANPDIASATRDFDYQPLSLTGRWWS